MTHTIEERVMKPYLRKLVRQHRQLNELIDTSKPLTPAAQIKQLKRLRLRIKDKIHALQRHYYGRSITI